MQRRKLNSSRFDRRSRTIFWHIHWHFPAAKESMHDLRVSEQTPLKQILQQHINLVPGNSLKRHALRAYVEAGLERLHILIKKEHCPVRICNMHCQGCIVRDACQGCIVRDACQGCMSGMHCQGCMSGMHVRDACQGCMSGMHVVSVGCLHCERSHTVDNDCDHPLQFDHSCQLTSTIHAPWTASSACNTCGNGEHAKGREISCVSRHLPQA